MQQKDTYKTLQKAAKIRHHRLSSLDGDVIPNLFYHTECYQRFTLNRDLEKIVQKETAWRICEISIKKNSIWKKWGRLAY